MYNSDPLIHKPWKLFLVILLLFFFLFCMYMIVSCVCALSAIVSLSCEHNKNVRLYVTDQLISAKRCISYKNQSFDLQYKLNDWFLYERQYWAEVD